MSRARCLLVAIAAMLGLSSTGCVGIVYAVYANAASSKIEQAKVLGAHETAEYEYYSATELLLKAQEEAATASYGDAISLASDAEDMADKAIELAKDAHQGAGR